MNQALDGLKGLLMYRLGAGVAGALGLPGLALAMFGVYGVVSEVWVIPHWHKEASDDGGVVR